MKRTEAITARLKAATPGPWHSTWDDEEDLAEGDYWGDETIVKSTAADLHDRDRLVVGFIKYDGDHVACSREDSALIANAPADLEWALARLVEAEDLMRRSAPWHTAENWKRWIAWLDADKEG